MLKPVRYLNCGRRSIPVYHVNFEYFQPNTHRCGDCVIRAVAKALDVSWEEALTILYNTARKINDVPISTNAITETLKIYGFVWKGLRAVKGEERPTVADFAKTHEIGRYVLSVAHHAVCAIGGKYYDVWDCGFKSVYGYWFRESSVAPGSLF